ncbi:hypothetical protein SELMODRAFT_420009 [Selaginella moellendorffii]|uniref:Zinc finger PHD-type domain-containing protein n=1 Tax=Selaginella moellendorffii TaxID=88036 RepID=D8SA95_SELML|nr:hypothetical protein SELMODRAFT_420009 [Selaginella moellendorffii]
MLHYMGRKVTLDVIKFILDSDDGPLMSNEFDPVLGIRYITGTFGSGKSCSVAAAVGHLHTDFASDKIKSRGIALLPVEPFIREPGNALFSALVLAFINDDQAFGVLLRVKDLEMKSVFKVLEDLKALERKVYVVFDDGNKLRSPNVCSEADREKARGFIRVLPLSVSNVVICASFQSSIRKQLIKDKSAPHLLILEVINKRSLMLISTIRARSWMVILIIACHPDKQRQRRSAETRDRQVTLTPPPRQAKDECRDKEMDEPADDADFRVWKMRGQWKTGALPPLVTYYVRDQKEKLKLAFSWYKKKVVEYVNKDNLAELAQGARGEELEYLPSVMDSRLIYRGKNRRARLGGDDSRLEPRIEFLDHVIEVKAEKVVQCRGRFSKQLLTGCKDVATLFCPIKLTHMGADVYYVSRDWIIVFQVSIMEATKAMKYHRRTLEVANELFKGEEMRKKLLCWIAHTEKMWTYAETSESPLQLVMSFTDVHKSLKAIDERLIHLRGFKSDNCYACSGTSKANDWIECDFCQSPYHQECIMLGDARKLGVWSCSVGEEYWKEDDEEKDPTYSMESCKKRKSTRSILETRTSKKQINNS